MADYANVAQLWGNKKKYEKKIFIKNYFFMELLAIISKTIVTKCQSDNLKGIRRHMLASDVYCSFYSTFYHTPQNTTNHNNIKFKKILIKKNISLLLCN